MITEFYFFVRCHWMNRDTEKQCSMFLIYRLPRPISFLQFLPALQARLPGMGSEQKIPSDTVSWLWNRIYISTRIHLHRSNYRFGITAAFVSIPSCNINSTIIQKQRIRSPYDQHNFTLTKMWEDFLILSQLKHFLLSLFLYLWAVLETSKYLVNYLHAVWEMFALQIKKAYKFSLLQHNKCKKEHFS